MNNSTAIWQSVGMQLPSILTGVTTAVITVLMTFKFYRIRDTVVALRAIKEETKQNREQAELVLEYIQKDIEFAKQGAERSDSVPQFQTSSFEHIKNSGVLTRLPSEAKEEIIHHYNHLDRINSQIIYRGDLRASAVRAMGSYDQRRDNLNNIIFMMIEICLEDKRSNRFRDELEDIDELEVVIPDSISTFKDVISETDKQLNNIRLSRIL